jgi:hypothetical protein
LGNISPRCSHQLGEEPFHRALLVDKLSKEGEGQPLETNYSPLHNKRLGASQFSCPEPGTHHSSDAERHAEHPEGHDHDEGIPPSSQQFHR